MQTAEERAPRRRWAWWHRQTPTTRRTLRTAATLLVTGLLAVVLGVTTASTHSSLGPHEADYQITLDRQVSLQMGPLGALIIDSPLPWPLGAEVVVREIPADLETAGSPLPGLLADLQSYGQLFGAPEAALADAVQGLVSDAVGRSVVAWSAMLVLLATGRLASRGRLRDEIKAALARPGVPALVIALVVSGTAAVAVPAMRQDRPAGYSPAVLDGTPLEGARITGRLADVVAVYGQVVKDYYEENQAFYDLAAANLAAAYAADTLGPDLEAVPSPTAAESPGAGEGPTVPDAPVPDDPSVQETPEGSDGASPAPEAATGEASPNQDTAAEPGTGAAQAETTTEVEPGEEGSPAEAGDPAADGTSPAADEESEPDPVTFLFVSDLHCNVGMSSVIATALDLTGAAALLDGGDTVVSGTSVESYCINAFAGAVPGDTPVVAATGNHDSKITAQQERDAGWTVLGGEVVDVAGVSILGDTDPTLTAVGAGTRPERDETVPEMETRLAETACAAADDGAVDILLVHNPRAGGATLDRGCARLQLSGHWHRTVGPVVEGLGVKYVSTSTGGGAGGGATVGPLTGDAELTVLRVDRSTGEPMDYRRILVRTDASVSLGPWYTFPTVDPDSSGGASDDPTDPGEGTGPGQIDPAETDGGATGDAAGAAGAEQLSTASSDE